MGLREGVAYIDKIITEPKEDSSAVSKEVDSAQLHTASLMSHVFHHLITQQLEN